MAAEAETEQHLVDRVHHAAAAFNAAYWAAWNAKLEVETKLVDGTGIVVTVRRKIPSSIPR